MLALYHNTGTSESNSTILTTGKDPFSVINESRHQRSLQTEGYRKIALQRERTRRVCIEEHETQFGTLGDVINGLSFKRRHNSLPTFDGIYKSVFGLPRLGRNQVLPKLETESIEEESDKHERHTL